MMKSKQYISKSNNDIYSNHKKETNIILYKWTGLEYEFKGIKLKNYINNYNSKKLWKGLKEIKTSLKANY